MEQWVIDLLDKYGLPTFFAVAILLLYRSQIKSHGEKLDKISSILMDLTSQISYVLSAIVNYRAGDVKSGDMMSGQAVYVGDKCKKDNADEKEGKDK